MCRWTPLDGGANIRSMPSLGSSHVPYAQFEAMLRAGNLPWIRRNHGRITMGLPDEARVCRLVAEQDPCRLERASVRWIKRFAATADGEQRSAYGLIVQTFDTMSFNPELAAEQLAALCADQGLDQ